MARPTKYTPEVVRKLTDAIRLGATYDLACKYAGVSEDSLARWRERYADFADALKEAEGAGAVGWLARIEQAARDGAWQAAAWKLERRYPEQYGRQIVDGNKQDVVVKVYTDPRMEHPVDADWSSAPPPRSSADA